jgi:MazG family protein|tara:strand:- start:477 stop:1250 length:774 start_codon:yes stop_codon:yes gene_type:complete
MVKTKTKIDDIVNVVKKLRDPKGGCPWDIGQNSKSLAKYTLEEAYEVVEAIELNKKEELKDELGDLLLQVVYHSVISEEKKQFNINDVIESSVKKMKLRHPHIFLNNKNIKTVSDVNEFWEYQKKIDRKKKGAKSVLDGISETLPAVTKATKVHKRAAQEGFDWPTTEATIKKVKEELKELEIEIKKKNKSKIEEELGDLFLSCINLSRKLKLDTETVIRKSNRKFDKRFRRMEKIMNKDDLEWNIKNLEKTWQKIK